MAAVGRDLNQIDMGLAGQLPQVVIYRRARADQCRQSSRRGHPFHHDQVVAGRAIRSHHVGDAEVHIGRDPGIGVDLAPAHRLPAFPAGEIKEAQVYRFLEFVRPIPEEKHHRGMRLVDFHERFPWRARMFTHLESVALAAPASGGYSRFSTFVDHQGGFRAEPRGYRIGRRGQRRTPRGWRPTDDPHALADPPFDQPEVRSRANSGQCWMRHRDPYGIKALIVSFFG